MISPRSALARSRSPLTPPSSARPRPRGRAASRCCALAFEVAEDETRALLAVSAASACLESFPAVHDLLIAAREVAFDSSVLVALGGLHHDYRAAA